MILLDGIDKHDDPQRSKLASEASSSITPIARAHTPTPSLPDYEASQAQLRPTTQSYSQIQQKRSRRRRCRIFTLYALAAYFVLTVVIGVPIIVMKSKRKNVMKQNPYTSWEDNDPIPPKSITLSNAPLQISSAKSCNAWNVKGRPDGGMFVSELQYNIPVNGSVFLNTNITYASNTTYLNQFAGSLLVAVNDNSSVPDGVVHVTMHHTTVGLGDATKVCQMETSSGGGLYIFAPKNLSTPDGLIFNITLLLPRNGASSRHIPSLLCHLPHFRHTYQQLDPTITFDSVVFGGAMSGVYVESLQADSAVVKASSAEIRGTFKVTTQLSLETVSAPINADVHLYNDGGNAPTFMHLTTGNSPLNANVTLHLPPPPSELEGGPLEGGPPFPPGPQFFAYAETFNAPLNVTVAHGADCATSNIRLRAVNNLGNTRVAVDSRYAGTFDVNTMFAQADVLTWDGTDLNAHYDDGDGLDDGEEASAAIPTSTASASAISSAMISDRDSDYDSDDDEGDELTSDDLVKMGKVRMFLPSVTNTATDSEATDIPAGRCLEYDLISSSEIRGWVGTPPRPQRVSSPRKHYSNMSHVQVVSSLSGAQLILET